MELARKPIDGIDLTSVLLQPNSSVDERPWYSYHGQSGLSSEHLAIIDQGWKLVVNGPRLTEVAQLDDSSHQLRLFHLERDPNETTNLAKQKPKKVQQLAKKLVDHRALQPENAVPPYNVGRAGFVPPPRWQLDSSEPDKLVGEHQSVNSE